MKTKTVKSVLATFILLLAVPGFGQPKGTRDGGDQNDRPLKKARMEEPSDVTMSSDDESFDCWDADTEANRAAIMEANPDFSDATALLFAGSQGDERGATELVKYAIAHGADVNAIDSDGMTPLMYFAQNGSQELVTLMLENQANMNLVDGQGNSLLIVAMNGAYAQVSTIQFLINSGLELGDKEVQTAFEVAEQYRNSQGMDAEAMFEEWMEFANYLLKERMDRFTTQIATFSQANLAQNVIVELPTDILNHIGRFLWAATSHL